MADAAPMPVLLEYQRRYLADAHKWKAACWARQTGKTFTTTLEAVIDVLEAEAAGRVSPWTIMSVSRDRALDAMENGVKRHLRAFRAAFEALDEPLEADELAHVVRLPGGSYIRAVAARPETARGMSDNLILDEFAHHRDNRAIWQAVLPIVSRPDRRVRVISTPAGVGDMFHQIMTDPAMPFSGHRYTVTIQDAVAAGLDRDIEELRRALADPVAWAQEFECAFIEGASAWLPYDLIIACEDERAGLPHLYQGGPAYVGMDIAARGDLTVIAVAEDMGGVLVLRELVEMRGESFAGQLFGLDRVMRQYRVVRATLDQTGMGEMVVEEARRRHGQLRVEGVLFTPPRRLDLATALRQRIEDRRLLLPRNPELRDDLHSVRRETGPTGAPRLVAARAAAGHADRFWALALACGAAADRPVDHGAWRSAGTSATGSLANTSVTAAGWGSVRREW